MNKRKICSILTTCTMVLSIFTSITVVGTKTAAAATATPAWNTSRYGDKIDIDAKLNYLSKDAGFIQNAEKELKEQAKKINFDGASGGTSTAAQSSFTFDGGTKSFLNINLDFKEFTLRSVGDNIEVWVANDLSYPEGDPRPTPVVTQAQVDQMKAEFDKNIYPKDTAFFGTPNQLDGSKSILPGMVEGMPNDYYTGSSKVIMLVDNVIDENYSDPTYPNYIAGFFWQTIERYINRNIITIDTHQWESRLESVYYGTTMHELQHLIHADNDAAEESWINEGMSTFSEFLGGYGHDYGAVNFYLDHPENSLVNWDDHRVTATGPETIADYGQVYLFTLYMNDKFGQKFIHDLAVNKKTGITSVEDTLKASGSNMNFTKLYQNFITALAVDSDRAGAAYKFNSIDLRDIPVDKAGTKRGMTVNYEKALQFNKDGVPAWGGDFKELAFDSKIRNISFNGVDFLPMAWKAVADPLDALNTVLWGNTGDEADNMLILDADLTTVKAATLTFKNYYDIEKNWDFGMVQVSTDNGATWKSLSNENTCSDVDPQGYPKIQANVPGFTGTIKNWRSEKFDLSAYTGQKILIAFRYMTDWGGTQGGWFIDDVNIQEIGFSSDCKSTQGFKSINEIMKKYINYTVTFINEKEVGNKKGENKNYKVVTIDPFNVTDTDALALRELFQSGKNYMITTHAASLDEKGPVDFTYKVELKTNMSKKKK